MQSNKAFQLRFLSLVVAALCASGAQAQLAPGALPTGGAVVGGQASIVQNGSTLHIHQTSGQALVNFSSFNVGSAALVDIRQPGAAAALLARVTGSDPSQIYGQITANGALWLVNPAGIMVGQGARIDVGSFIASTLNVSDADFLAGRLTFTSGGNAGMVRNAGAINAAGGGRIYLVGQKVENTGSLGAPQGEVLLAAGQNVQLVDTGHPGVSIALSGAGGDTSNLGRIVAEAGRIGLGGALVSNAGLISASSAVSEGGRVFLRAVELKTTATSDIQADGTSGGRVVLIGDRSDIDGRLSATGSAGPGGFVDTSGHSSLKVRNAPTLGKGGEWLIDPSDLEVVDSVSDNGASVERGVIVSRANGTQIAAGTITEQLNAGVNVSLQTGNDGTGDGNIAVNAAITKTRGENASLMLRAHNNIEINAPITSSAGALDLSLKNNFYGNPADTGHAATLNASLDLNGGLLEVSQGEALGNGTLNIVSGTTTLHGAARIHAAAVNVQKDARVSMDSPQTLQGAWTNAGQIELQDAGALNLGNADASLVNDGRLILSGTNVEVLTRSSEVSNLTNNGEIVKTSAGEQDIARLNNGATGRIMVDAGTLSLSRTVLGGSVQVAEGAALLVKGTEQGVEGSKLGAGVAITGAGAMTWRGNVEMLGDVTLGTKAPALNIAPGSLTFVGGGPDNRFTFTTHNRIAIQGEFVLNGGTVWDNHGTVYVGTAQPGVLSFNTDTIFNNKAGGLVDVTYGSRLYPSNQTTINNDAGALMQIASNGGSTFSGGYQGRVVNSGTIVKTGAPTMTAPIENLAGGVLDIREGGVGVRFTQANPNAGTVRIAPGAALHSTGAVDLHNAGTIRGSGTVDLGGDGAYLVNNGIVAPGGLDELGTLTINGGYRQGPLGALNIRLSRGTADRLDVTGPVQLDGTLNLSMLGAGLPVDGTLADFLTGANPGNAGAFSMVNAPEIVTPETTGTLSVVYPASGTALAQVKATTAPTVVVVPPVEPPVEPPVVVPPVVVPPVVEPPVVVPPVVEPPVVVPPVVVPPVVEPPVVVPPVVEPPVVTPPVVQPPVVVPPVVVPPVVTPPVVEPPVVVPPVVIPPVVEPPVVVPPVVVEPPVVVPPVVIPPVVEAPVVVPPVVVPPVVIPPVVEPPVVEPPVVVPPVVEPPVIVPPVVIPPVVEPPVVVPPVVVIPPVVIPPVIEPPVVVIPPVVEPPVVVPPVVVIPPVVTPPVVEPPVVVPPVVVIPPVIEPPVVVVPPVVVIPPVVTPPVIEPPVVVPPVVVIPPVVTPPVVEPPVVVPPVVVIPPVVIPPVVEPPVVVVPPVVPVPPVVTPPVVVPPVVVVPPMVTPPVIQPPVVVPAIVVPPVTPPVVTPAAPLPDMCAIAPGSNLCQVLPPPPPSVPVPPPPSVPVAPVIQQASNFLITSILASSSPVAPTTKEIALSVSKGETAATAPVDATGQSNKSSIKKTYCN